MATIIATVGASTASLLVGLLLGWKIKSWKAGDSFLRRSIRKVVEKEIVALFQELTQLDPTTLRLRPVSDGAATVTYALEELALGHNGGEPRRWQDVAALRVDWAHVPLPEMHLRIFGHEYPTSPAFYLNLALRDLRQEMGRKIVTRNMSDH